MTKFKLVELVIVEFNFHFNVFITHFIWEQKR